jgi:tetratricopeptide (TPR) repeat protein
MRPIIARGRIPLLLPLILMAILQLGSLPALAQSRDYALPGGQDYYEARTTKDQIATLANVERYHLGIGIEQMKKARYPQALGDFEFILRYYPNHPQVLRLLSDMCLKARGNFCKVAEDWFEKALARNPEAGTTHLLYGFHMHRTRQVKEAVKAYQRAIELQPNSMNAHYNLGLAYADLKEYELANRHAQRSYQLGANMPGLRLRLEKLGKWDPAASIPAADIKPAGGPQPTSDGKAAEQAAQQVQKVEKTPE